MLSWKESSLFLTGARRLEEIYAYGLAIGTMFILLSIVSLKPSTAKYGTVTWVI